MCFRKRLTAVAALIAVVGATLIGSQVKIKENDIFSFGSQKKETIYFWYSDDSLTNYLNSAAIAFGEKEDARVIPVLVSDRAYLEDINRSGVKEEKQAPDAYLLKNDSLEKAYLAGLASVIADPLEICSTKNFPQTALSAVTYDNNIVAYPFSYETNVLVYNRDYVDLWCKQQEEREDAAQEAIQEVPEDEAQEMEEEQEGNESTPVSELISPEGIPLSIEGMLHFADTFDVPEGVDGVMKWDVSDIFYNYWFVGKYLIVGGETGDDDSCIAINTPETLECLETYQSLNQFFSIESDTVTYNSCIDDFMEGKIVFTLANSDLVKELQTAKEEGRVSFDFGFANIPQITGRLGSRSLSVTEGVVINGYSAHKQLANRFAAFLTGEYSGDLYDRTGRLSANKNAYGPGSDFQVFYNEYAHSVSLPKMMEIGNLWLQLEALFAKVWNGAEITPLLENMENQIATQTE